MRDPNDFPVSGLSTWVGVVTFAVLGERGSQGCFCMLSGAIRRQGCRVGSSGPSGQRLDPGDWDCWGQGQPPLF